MTVMSLLVPSSVSFLAHMYIIPNQVNLAIMPSQISPVGAVAAIFFKWPLCHHISETKRRRVRAIIVDSIYRFSGA